MCYKVANQGESSDEIAQFFSHEEEDESAPVASSGGDAGEAFSGFGQEREMSAMVSALTHVMAGDSGGPSSSSLSWGGDGIGGGVKREREELPPATAARYHRGFGEFGSFVHPSTTVQGDSFFSLDAYSS